MTTISNETDDRPVLLDLCCGLGGAAMGYSQAGFRVIGADLAEQPAYPFEFHRGDCVEFLLDNIHQADAVHLSAPCQGYTWATNKVHRDKYTVDLIETVRDICDEHGMPLVIENVPQADDDYRHPVFVTEHGDIPVQRPVLLCGEMFGLRVIRHRLFEVGEMVPQPEHANHRGSISDGTYVTVAGHGGDNPKGGSSLAVWKEAMGIDWVTPEQYGGSTKDAKHQLAEAIPPAYTRYIGEWVLYWMGLTDRPEYEQETVMEQETLTIAVGDRVRQVGKELTHQVKLDKRGAQRTMCGVPIRGGNGWGKTPDALSCPTCSASAAKGDRPSLPRRGTPAGTETALVAPAARECSATHNGQHAPAVLKTDYSGQSIAPWCTGCGQVIAATGAPQPAADIAPDAQGVI